MKSTLRAPAFVVVAACLFIGAGVAALLLRSHRAPAPRPAVKPPPIPVLLKQIEKPLDPETMPWLGNAAAARSLRQKLARATNPDQKRMLEKQLDLELLNAGETQKAIQGFMEYLQSIRNTAADTPEEDRAIRLELAICFLRLGEQQNCLAGHNADSCIVPIHGGGIHQKQYGSRTAIGLLTDLLQRFPDDLESAWLLNLAYMTIGEYPQGVPARWRVPPSVFQSDYPLPHFRNVAPDVGLDVYSLAGGAAMDDFEGNGNLDIVCSSVGFHDPLRDFHNNGDGTFTDRTKEAGLLGETGGQNLVVADYNNDGYPDILVLRGGWFGKDGHWPMSLLRNNGNGTFTDVTEQAGLLSLHPRQTAVWLDYDGDGKLDLFVGNESTPGDPNPCELYHNNGDGTFTECAASCGLNVKAFVKAATVGDFNQDGRPDLFLSVDGGPNLLFRNDGPDPNDHSAHPRWRFTDVAAKAGVTQPLASFSCFFFDYDNDGWPDLFVSGYSIHSVADVAADYLGLPSNGIRAKLYHNNHDGTFTDVTQDVHLDKVLETMGCGYGDLDNDGYLDFYLGTGDPDLSTLIPNRMFRNAGGEYFQDVTTAGGFGNIQKGHGVAFGDIDNDGDQDIFEVMGGAVDGDRSFDVLYENPGNGNHWLKLKLVGVQDNREGIGAEVKVIVRTPQGERQICRTETTGASYGSVPSRLEIGLGDAQAVERVEIFWPVLHKTQVITGLQRDRMYRITEGDPHPVLVPLKRFHLRHRTGPAPNPAMSGMTGMS